MTNTTKVSNLKASTSKTQQCAVQINYVLWCAVVCIYYIDLYGEKKEK